MVRRYKRTPGSRKYADFSDEKLQMCLNSIKSGEMSQRVAATHFDISVSTIKRKLKGRSLNKPGHPAVLSSDEEQTFACHLDKICEFGFPVDEMDFRFIVKNYLDKQGKTVKCFKNNLPGRDWAKLFLSRQQQLSIRFANNIKRSRAAIDESVINDYIDNLRDLAKNVPPDRIYNYDETCMSDDPGRTKIICRRGCKYPERVINSTKSNITVMFCGNAAGTALPPYIIYKAEHLWSTWAENGPAGARYNRSKHGWIDLALFEEWFSTHLLPVLNKQEGTKIVVGDNLSSHLSMKVVKLCEENDVKFVCLSPNSSHLTQPHDVAFFRPLKSKWRAILTNWKQSEAGKRATSLPKDQFPMLLRTVLHEIAPNVENNLKAGFKKAGIFSTSADPILSRLPKLDKQVNLDLIGESFLAHLEQKRVDFVKPQGKKKKINVAPGKSITVSDIQSVEEQDPTSKNKTVKGAKSALREKPSSKKPHKKPKLNQRFDDSTSEDDTAYSLQDSDGNSDFVYSENETSDDLYMQTAELGQGPSKNPQSPDQSSLNLDTVDDKVALKNSIQIGNFVAVIWKGVLFPGVVNSLDENGVIVDCMQKCKKGWKWPATKDVMKYKWMDVKKKINPPKLLKRGVFIVPNV